jgi:hypothetical protein
LATPASYLKGKQQLSLKINNLFLIGYYHRAHREHREMVRKMRDLVRFLRKYALIFLSVLSVVKIQRELLKGKKKINLSLFEMTLILILLNK